MPAPARGRRAASRASPFQQVDVLEIQRLAVAVNGEDDREADGGLGGRDRHYEEHEYLAGDAEPLRPRGPSRPAAAGSPPEDPPPAARRAGSPARPQAPRPRPGPVAP